MSIEETRRDFDTIAQFGDSHDSGSDRYDGFLISLVSPEATAVLGIGCGTGRLTRKFAAPGRTLVAVDLSQAMITRARAMMSPECCVEFLCGDFLDANPTEASFDCVISAATLHHRRAGVAAGKMRALLRPRGRLILHDLLSLKNVLDGMGMALILAYEAARRLLRIGRPLSPTHVRKAWNDHAARDSYMTQAQIRTLFEECLPGSHVRRHWGFGIPRSGASPRKECDLAGVPGRIL